MVGKGLVAWNSMNQGVTNTNNGKTCESNINLGAVLESATSLQPNHLMVIHVKIVKFRPKYY